ncbi:MAG: U32 family peptidase [Bacteroidetes bacterium]|nr:U32 family peptidase [Bacteroidota bacterium]
MTGKTHRDDCLEKSGTLVAGWSDVALRAAVSGRCFLSHHSFGLSSSCGECTQPCRENTGSSTRTAEQST